MASAMTPDDIMDPPAVELKATNEQLFRVVADLQKVVRQRNVAQQEMVEAHFEAMYLLALGADFREGRNGLRLIRIGATAELLARAAGMPDDYCSMMKRAAPLHDIGMVAIPDALLRKRDDLSHDEWQQWRSHTEIGARILSSSFDNPLMSMAAEIALTHHESFQGNGYPAGLAAGKIPLSGRIVALAEYFETHTGTSGNQAWPMPDGAVPASIRELSGQRFDPQLVELFMSNLPAIAAARSEIELHANSFQNLVANIKPELPAA